MTWNLKLCLLKMKQESQVKDKKLFYCRIDQNERLKLKAHQLLSPKESAAANICREMINLQYQYHCHGCFWLPPSTGCLLLLASKHF